MSHYRSKRSSRRSRRSRSFSPVKKGVSEALGFMGSGVDLLSDAAKTTFRKGSHMITMKRGSRRRHGNKYSRRNRRR